MRARFMGVHVIYLAQVVRAGWVEEKRKRKRKRKKRRLLEGDCSIRERDRPLPPAVSARRLRLLPPARGQEEKDPHEEGGCLPVHGITSRTRRRKLLS